MNIVKSTVKDGALGIAFTKFAGDLDTDSLGQRKKLRQAVGD